MAPTDDENGGRERVVIRVSRELKSKCEIDADRLGFSLNEWGKRAFIGALDSQIRYDAVVVDLEMCRAELANRDREHRDAIAEREKRIRVLEQRITRLQKLYLDLEERAGDMAMDAIMVERVKNENESLRTELDSMAARCSSSMIFDRYLETVINRIIDERLNTEKTEGK